MTDEQIIEMAKQLGFQRMRIDHDYYVCFSKEIVEFAKLVAEHEREACAKVCDEHPGYMTGIVSLKIRARGQQTPEGGEA